MKNIAVILSGCGYLDGAEIRESVLTYLHLDMNKDKVKYSSFAPNINQHHVVNHKEAHESDGSRNVLEESARICRGKVEDMNSLNVDDFDALIMPGGFGVAKNLSDFAFNGPNGKINENLQEIIKKFHSQKKPIGYICISPAIGGTVLKDFTPLVTIGNDEGTIKALESIGVKHQVCKANEVCFDEVNNLFSTPAYMYDDETLDNINTGIKYLIDGVISKL